MTRPLSRRSLLKLLAASGVSLLGLSTPLRQAAAQNRTALVIGAGAAGLAAATLLRNQRWTVTVLEARDRVGGRVHTDTTFAPHPIELGAEYLHGDNISTWDALRIRSRDAREAFESDNNIWLQRDNALIGPPRWFLTPRIDLIDGGLDTLARVYAVGGAPDISLADMLVQRRITLDPSLYRVVDNAFQAEYAAALDQHGVYGLLEQRDDPGGDYRLIAGYSSFFEEYAAPLDVRLNTVVERIAYHADGVTVTTRGGESFSAQKCVITLPLGVLQAGDVTFDPPLPADKQDAIARLGSGAVGKLLLRFDEAFWPQRMELVYTERDSQMFWRPGFGLSDEAPVLTAYFGARTAERFSALGEAGAVAAALADLEAIFSVSGLAARLQAARFVDWLTDPYSKMGYSFTPPGTAGLRDVLALPVDDVLFWAGEATNRERPALVHGAIDSGLRAAREVLRLVR